MSQQGLCSRREADSYIERGWVYVDGVRITELGTRIDPAQKITLDRHAEAKQQQRVTLLLNKPVGYVSAQPEKGYHAAVELITPDHQWKEDQTQQFNAAHLRGLAPAGRLDIDSTGLLILTQDGRIAKQLIGENAGMEKEYLVRVEGHLRQLDRLAFDQDRLERLDAQAVQRGRAVEHHRVFADHLFEDVPDLGVLPVPRGAWRP